LARKKISTKLNFGAISYRENENMELIVDTSRIKSLGWRARVGFESGIDKVIDEMFKNI